MRDMYFAWPLKYDASKTKKKTKITKTRGRGGGKRRSRRKRTSAHANLTSRTKLIGIFSLSEEEFPWAAA